jgi:hypothetical protein
VFPPSLVVEVEIIHKAIIEAIVTITNHGRWRRVGTSKSMIVTILIDRDHGTRCQSRPTKSACHRWYVAPLSRYRVVATNMASN